MKTKIFLLIVAAVSLFGVQLPKDVVKKHLFYQKVEVNSQIIQLSSAKQEIMSYLSGHLEKYYIKPSQKVKKGQKVALIDSPELSQMTSSYISLKEQVTVQERNYDSVKKLYDKGMSSLQDLNRENIKKETLLSKLNALKSQLASLGIDPSKLKKATSLYTLYAHTDGIVASLEAPLHSTIGQNKKIASIVKTNAYYLKSYIPLYYAKKIGIGDRVVFDYFGKKIEAKITQILPQVDKETQRVIALASIETRKQLFIGAYVASEIYFGKPMEHLAVKKSALSFFNNEWVVFLPKKGEHKEEKRSEEEEDIPYDIAVVKIVMSDDSYVAIEGLEARQEYISGKSYYVKSALLKGSIGDGD